MPSSESEQYDLLDRLAEEFAARFRRGERPTLKEYTDNYPELADEIRDLFPALVKVEKADDARQGEHEPAGLRAENPLPSQVGDYRLLREIGRGGMGVVYEAEQVSLGRRVALKVLPRHGAADRMTLERFRREARAAARLHHTNIVPVFEVGQDGDVRFYAMQFIQGQSLDAVITELRHLRIQSQSRGTSDDQAKSRRETRALAPSVAHSILTGGFLPEDDVRPTSATALEPAAARPASAALALAKAAAVGVEATEARPSSGLGPDSSSTPTPISSAVLPGGTQLSVAEMSHRVLHRSAAHIGRQAAAALAHAHARGVIHRDIKPSNLLLDTDGIVWVADFGLAKAEDDGLTQTGDVLGTVRYMAPERFSGQSDPRSDVYALGLTLYELLVLRPAFDSPNRLALIDLVKNVDPPRPRSIDPRIPLDLETIVLKAVEKDPKARYASADALNEDLRRFLADEPIQARQVSTAERYWRWARRNPVIATLGGALLVLLVATTVGSIVAASYFRSLAVSEFLANQKSQKAERVAVAAQQDAILERNKAQRNEKAERWERYRSNIAAASAAFQIQNADAASSALDETPTEHRNWEWQYLHSQLDDASLILSVPGAKHRSHILSPSGRQVAVSCMNHNQVYLYAVATGRLEAILSGHSAPVTSVAYRPDGKQLATSSNDQTIRLWEPATGRQMALLAPEVTPPHPDHNPLVAYNSDGSRIVSSGPDGGTSRLWDTTTGKEIAEFAKWQEDKPPDPGHPAGKVAVFSPDSKRVAARSGEYARLCDAATGRPLAVLGPHAKAVARLAYSPDGKRIASATYEGSSDIHLWDGESGNEVAVLRGHTAWVSDLLFSPDGSRLVSVGGYPENLVRLWDSATGGLLAVLAGHKNAIPAVAFSPDGTRIATVSMDQTGRLWDGRTGQSLAVLAGHTHLVVNVLFSPNGARVVTGSYDGTLRLWSAATGDLIGVLRGLGDTIHSAPLLTPDGSRLLSGCGDGTVRIWDLSLVDRNGVLRGHESYVYDVAFSPEGTQVASVAWDGTARLWDPTTGRQTGLLKREKQTVSGVTFSRDGRRLATVERARGISLWDVATSKVVRNWRASTSRDARAAFSPEGTLLACGCAGGPVRLWDVKSGDEIAQLKGHAKSSLDVSFDPSGRLLASAGQDATVRLWDVATRTCVAVLRGHTDHVWQVEFSADGKLVISCSHDKTIRLWDVQAHEPLAIIPMGTIVWGLALSPDGTRLAAACRDTTIRLIDVASRQQVAVLRGHTDYVHAVAWSPDGTRLVSGSGDYTVRIWDALSPAARARRPDALHRIP
jgi:WD40 repeat protein/serine/threonine protein kinase